MIRFMFLLTAILALLLGCEQAPPAASEPAAPPATQPAALPAAGAPSGPGGEPAGPAAGSPQESVADEARERARQALDTAAQWVRKTRDEYLAHSKGLMTDIERRIEELKSTPGATWPDLERQLEKLQQQAARAREQLERARDAGTRAWQDARHALDEATRELCRLTGVEYSVPHLLGDDRQPPPETQPGP